MTPCNLEICCGDLASVANAIAGGADRIELCSGLSEGGLTPSAGLIEQAGRLARGKCRLHVLIRARNGDFCYDEADRLAMLADVEFCAGSPLVDGIVVGALTADGYIDLPFIEACIRAAKGKSMTFHRAFDLCRQPFEALEQIIALGFDRILTSGCAASALEGAGMLRSLNTRAAGRITILGGAGVSSANAAEILKLTGICELHASARRPEASKMKFRHEGVSMGAPDTDEYTRFVTSAEETAALHKIIKNHITCDII